jgi:hypothetical protein
MAFMNRNQSLYETDFHAWAFEQARKLRAGEAVDAKNLAEELEDLGRTQQQQLQNRLAVLLQHMLKWEYQPERRSPSWAATMKEQRRRVNRLLAQNPSLKAELAATITEAYATAVTFAVVETGILEEDFPAECPYSGQEILENPEPERSRNGSAKRLKVRRRKPAK